MTRYYRLKQILEVIPVSKSSIWQWVKEKKFPKPIKLGAKTTVWRSDSIEAYINGTWKSENAADGKGVCP